MKLTGLNLVREGDKLRYPWRPSLHSLSSLCDQVLFNVDPTSEDNTFQEAKHFAELMPGHNIIICRGEWNMSNTGGSELARQINVMLPHVPKDTDWIVYMQADEMIHEKDFSELKRTLAALPSQVTQLELYRTYFWGDLEHRAPKYEIWLGRIFRPGSHVIGGDGMHIVRKYGEVARSPFWIYHYTRIGDEDVIARRVNNLDRMYHDPEEHAQMPLFKYDAEDLDLVEYGGTHPHGIKDFYHG